MKSAASSPRSQAKTHQSPFSSLQNTNNEESGSELVSINPDYHGINDDEE